MRKIAQNTCNFFVCITLACARLRQKKLQPCFASKLQKNYSWSFLHFLREIAVCVDACVEFAQIILCKFFCAIALIAPKLAQICNLALNKITILRFI